MRARRRLVGGLGLALMTAPPIGARPTQERPGYQATATAVLVDVVVRDRHGRPVTDLNAADFELREDGVLQELGSFTRVSRGGGIGVRVGLREPGATTLIEHGRPAASDDAAAASPTSYPAVTALVFDALSADAVSLCQRAALAHLPMSGLVDARVAVFSTEPSLRVLQGFTDDPALVREGVRRVLPAGTALKELQSERMAKLRERRDQLNNLADPGAQGGAGGSSLGGGNAAAIGEAEQQKRLVQGEMRVLQSFESLDRDQRGFGTMGALSTVLRSLAEMPGRKTLIFFSEGLPASPVLQARLQTVVEAANRVNVTVYAVDASGLRTISGTRDTRIEVEEAGKERLRQSDATNEPTDQPVMRLIERTEDLIRYDSQAGLARLAEETGGFLFRDTNDLRRAFTRIGEDMRFHYLLTYAPSKQTFDGTFRTIGVKVKRPGVEVFARKGYRALRTPPAVSLDYEAPALTALESPRLAQDFPFSSIALSFPEPSRPGLAPLLVRVATDHLTYREDARQGVYAADASIVVRVRDQSGRVVQKVSQHYELNGRLEELAAARRGEILFFRVPELAPGLYAVEAAVADGAGARTSARVSTLEVPPPKPGETRVSSVVLVRRSERVPAGEQDPANPLYVGDRLLYPNAGEALSRSVDRELTFYYTVYPRPSASPAPGATIELLRSGRSLARMPVTLARADAAGRIQQVSRLPLQPLADGTYELRVSVQDGAQASVRSTFFTVKD